MPRPLFLDHTRPFVMLSLHRYDGYINHMLSSQYESRYSKPVQSTMRIPEICTMTCFEGLEAFSARIARRDVVWHNAPSFLLQMLRTACVRARKLYIQRWWTVKRILSSFFLPRTLEPVKIDLHTDCLSQRLRLKSQGHFPFRRNGTFGNCGLMVTIPLIHSPRNRSSMLL